MEPSESTLLSCEAELGVESKVKLSEEQKVCNIATLFPTLAKTCYKEIVKMRGDEAMDEAIAINQRAAEHAAEPARSLQPSLTPDIIKAIDKCVGNLATISLSSLRGSSLRAEVSGIDSMPRPMA